MSEPRALLRVEGLVAGYGRNTVLHGTDFAVAPHTVTTLIGPNGAGKSTVFRTLFGLIAPREGRVWFDDRDVSGLAPARLLALGIAYVPQGRNLFPELSVEENLELGGVTLGDQRRRRERIERVYARFPFLGERRRSQASTLSGGEQKVLEIGRALMLEPRLLLVDEPSIGLAPRVMSEVFGLLAGLRAAGVTVLMVEQNARRALAMSDRGIVLEQGRVALEGAADTILADPRIHSLFLGGAMTHDAGPASSP